jgi:O-antigen/teichoic acid export membrane protein
VIETREHFGGRSIVSDSTETLFLKVLFYVVAFGASVLISRGLGPEGRGEYYLPIVAAVTMITLCNLGLEQVNVFLFGSRGLSIDRLAGQNGFIALTIGGIGVVLLLLAPSMLPALFVDIPVILLVLAGLTIPFSLHTQFSAGLLTLQGQVTWQFRAALLAGGVQTALLLGLFFTQWFAVGSVLGVNLAAVILTWALMVWALRGMSTTWVRWDQQLLWDTLRHSLVLHVGMVLFFLHLRLDMFMVKGMIGTAALGQYSLSVVLAETVLLATDSLAIAILPRQMGNTLEEAASLALKGARINVLVAITLGFLWAALGGVVIKVFFGQDFSPAYLPLVGLVPGMVFLGMQRVCGGPVLRAGRPGKITSIYALSLLCNGMLNLWWIPIWGIVGAALASTVSYGLGAALFLAWTSRLAGVSLSQGIVPRGSDVVSLRQAAIEARKVLFRSNLAKKQVD